MLVQIEVWSNGMVECWRTGYGRFTASRAIGSSVPVFQYSIIPLADPLTRHMVQLQ